MSTSQALMALMSTGLRSVGGETGSQGRVVAGDGDAFAALLAEQLPAELEAMIQELSPEQLASLEQAALAVGGNNLPGQLQEWLQQLPAGETDPAAEDAVGLIGQWMQWIQQDAAAPTTTTGSTSTAPTGTPMMAGAAQLRTEMPLEGEPGEVLDDELGGRLIQAKEPGSADTARQNPTSALQQGNQLASSASQQSAQGTQQELGLLQQRGAIEPSPTAAALFGKLIEQMEGKQAGRGEESDTLDGLQRSLAPNSGNNAALTARPVAAPMQPATVPFGHQSWGEAMVERVMWMSSQNLRSVEIQLDPAELGPLEIHIQNRGQELQVQFISQNPGVREALEGQMHRLREMFAGQGMEQAEVSVADRSAGEQARQGEGQLAERSANRSAAGDGPAGQGDGDVADRSGERVVQPLRGLVDYYV